MKKQMRKLKLNFETLRHLTSEDSQRVLGAGSFVETNCGVPSACWAATCTATGCPECPGGAPTDRCV